MAAVPLREDAGVRTVLVMARPRHDDFAAVRRDDGQTLLLGGIGVDLELGRQRGSRRIETTGEDAAGVTVMAMWLFQATMNSPPRLIDTRGWT